MIGRRNDAASPHQMEAGEFGRYRMIGHAEHPPYDQWWVRTPNGLLGRLSSAEDVAIFGMSGHHHVEEHEDGLISVTLQPGNSNSIKVEGWNGLYGERRAMIGWHGYIHHGEWRPC